MAMIGIVPEELKEENYEFWKACLMSYLVGQGLWDIVSREPTSIEEATPEWQRKNAQALHAIQLAYGSRAYFKYKKSTHVYAKFAWDHLAEMRPIIASHDHTEATLDYDSDYSNKRHIGYEILYRAVEDGNVERVKEIVKNDPDAGRAIVTSHRDTALHAAILSGKVDIALELVKLMAPEDLEIGNEFGATPLSLTAITGNTKLARAMVHKNRKLVAMKKTGYTEEASLPVIVASVYGRKPMVDYLYAMTPKDLFDPIKSMDGALLINNLLAADIFDIAFKLLNRFPRLGVAADHYGNFTLHTLAHKPSAFASESQFPFWKRWIYRCVRIHSPWDIQTPKNEILNGSEHTIDIFDDEYCSDEEEFISRPSLLQILLQFFVPDIKDLHEKKLVNDGASKFLNFISKDISVMSQSHLEKMEIIEAMKAATKHNMVEFLMELLTYNPDFIWKKDKKGRTIFSYAIIHRQEKIFSLFYSLGTRKSIVASRHDIFHNNFLHLAAKLSPPDQLERFSGAALQMQSELQWFKEVESIVPPKYKNQVNGHNWKPSALFTEEHKDLAKAAEKWMKNTAGSSMIVGTLIASVMFTTAFTIPGGNNDKSGVPIMLDTDRNAFMIFMVSNGLSLFASSTSVLMFLGILTARYAENDFLKSLPTKLIFGNACLFFSILTMMVSFAAAMYLMLHKTLPWVFIPLIVFTFPILVFSALQFPLIIEMFFRTYGWWYKPIMTLATSNKNSSLN